MVGVSNDMCSGTVCDPTPNFDSDLDLDTDSDSNAAWAGIAVVIVFVVVSGGLWFGIRRRRRARGGHNSIATGATHERRLGFTRRLFLFWRRSPRSSEQPISVEAEMELGRNEEPKDGRDSVASNLKRTTTSGTVDVNPPPAAKLNNQQKEMDPEAGQYPMMPMRHSQLQSTETVTSPSQPLPTHNSRPSTSSSQRTSLSRLSIPPPGLGPPVHQPDPPPAASSTSQN